MPGTTAICRPLPLLLLGAASPAWATVKQPELWATVDIERPIGEAVTGSFELSHRQQEPDDELRASGTITFDLSEAISVSGQARLATRGGLRRYQQHQQLTARSGAVSYQLRVEQTFIEQADRPRIRLRQKIGLTHLEDENTTISSAAEVFYIAQSDTRGEPSEFKEWRLEIMARQHLLPKLAAEIRYRLNFRPNEAPGERVSHIPIFALTWSL